MPREADTSSREIAFAKVKELRTRYGDAAERIHDASEASTRVMLIDEILVALGWSRADFNPETPAGKGWIDYLLSADQIPRFIVEAKKTGHTFAHPKPRLHESEYSLAYLKRAFKAGLTNVLEQATTYAREKAVPYAVLTNGAEWLLVQVIATSSQDPERLKGFYFGNLLSDHCNFDLFWELLSKPAVMDGSLEEHLSQLNTVPASETLMCSNEYGDLRWKPLISDRFLREFYSRFFTDITDEGRRRMLERCFATDARLNQYQSELKRALRDTAPGFLPIDTQDISPGEGQKLLLEETGDQAGRVILVTGSVGCGKSTLVTKVLVEAKQQERNRKRSRNLIVLKIDLIDEVNEEARDTAVTLWRYIEEQWYKEQQESYTIEALRRYFEREISGLRREQFADVIHHDESAFIRKEAELLN
ncbi:MAG TPA: AAA family ATPase, partial [Caldilineaceae bacterium]|nr:AAA family ATPase [Caldilineaceae bacterium]